MEKIIINPGLQHLAEEIFLNLDTEDLKICTEINQPCKQILENALFWLKKFTSLSKENQKDWMKIIKLVKTSDERNASVLDELNEKVQFSSKVRFLANFELNLAHFSKKELELN